MAKCLLTERKQLKAHATGIVPGRLGQVGPRQVGTDADGRQQVAGDGQMEHLLHKSNAKSIDSRSLSLNNGLMSSP